MTKKFTSKDPEEIILITFDFGDVVIDSTETITAVVAWEISVFEGTDLTPNNLFTGIPTYDASTATHLITGGINNCSYLISCTVDTNKGQRLKMSGILPIVSQGN